MLNTLYLLINRLNLRLPYYLCTSLPKWFILLRHLLLLNRLPKLLLNRLPKLLLLLALSWLIKSRLTLIKRRLLPKPRLNLHLLHLSLKLGNLLLMHHLLSHIVLVLYLGSSII